MSSTGPRPVSAPKRFPLVGHASAGSIAAYRRGQPVTAAELLRDVAHAAQALPEARHVLNLCGDRYRFAVTLLAAIVRGQTTLLPPTTTPNVIASLRRFAGDAYFVADDPAVAVDLPRFDFAERPSDPCGDPALPAIPTIPADQVVAYVFTSGSTGEPQPHFKTWGGLVLNIRGEAARLGVGPGHAILGTVPPQHMYGFESTVLLPLLSGAALTAERLYLPADIDDAIARLAAPRTMFTTPFHLKAWLASGEAAALETLVSATAPLSTELAREAEARTGARLYEIYGCTEAGQIATRRTALTREWELMDGLRLRDSDGQATVSGGHVEQPVALQDVIEIAPGGTRFQLHGRFADLVNIAGKRNSIAYLNHQLTAIPGVKDGVFFLPDEAEPDGVTRLTAFAVAPGMDARTLLAALRTRIDAAFIPRPLYVVEALPRQLTGKIPRESLVALAAKLRATPS
jgi:acyl-coenzyme A synthetase/AMP-(fatty) acid ligase